VGKHEIFSESLEHSLTIVLLPKLDRRHLNEAAHMPAEALRRRIVKPIGNVGDGEPGILEELRGSDQACHGQVALWRRQFRSKEAAHEGAGNHAQVTRERPHGPYAARKPEEDLEESPAVWMHPRQVGGKLRESDSIDVAGLIRQKDVTKSTPTGWLADIDERLDPAPA
jgi:hypothetical protein